MMLCTPIILAKNFHWESRKTRGLIELIRFQRNQNIVHFHRRIPPRSSCYNNWSFDREVISNLTLSYLKPILFYKRTDHFATKKRGLKIKGTY